MLSSGCGSIGVELDLVIKPPAALCTDPNHDRDWANIPDELLISIFDIVKKLPPAHYIRLPAVCKSWSHAAESLRPQPTLQKKPYLMMFPETHPHSIHLLNVAAGNNNITHVLDYSPPEIAGKWCIGSQQGRLVLLDEFSNISVLNPLTGSYIRLPEITTIPGVTPTYDPNGGSSLLAYDYFELGDDINNLESFKIDVFRQRVGMKKVVFSRDFTAALAIFGLYNDILAYLRPGDCGWTTINTRVSGDCYQTVLDIMCWGGGEGGDWGSFLVVFAGGRVFSLDITGPSAEMTRVSKKLVPPHDGITNADRYLVDISGVIMQVCRKALYRTTTGFSIWRLDLLSSTWTPVDNLDGYSLFVGSCYSMAFLTTADGAFGLRSNCIYFANSLHGLAWYNGTQDIGVYSMNDASIERISLQDHKSMRPVPVWIVPSGY